MITKLLRRKEFLFFAIALISLFIGEQIQKISLTWILFNLGGSKLLSYFSFFYATFLIPGLLISKYISEKTGIFNTAFYTNFIRFFILIVFSYTINYTHNHFFIMFIACISGLCDGLYYPCTITMQEIILSSTERASGIPFFSAVKQTSIVVGLFLSGMIVSRLENHMILLLISTFFLNSAIFFYFMQNVLLNKIAVEDESDKITGFMSYLNHYKSLIFYMLHNRWLIKTFLITSICSPILQSINTIIIPSYIFELHYSAKDYSYLIMSYTIGSFLAALLLINFRKKVTNIKDIFIIFSMNFILIIFILFTNKIIYMIIICLFSGFTRQLTSIMWDTLIIEKIDKNYIQSFSSFNYLVAFIFSPLLYFATGNLYNFVTSKVILLIFIIFGGTISLLGMRINNK